jgi:hypothetical protein
MKKFSVIAVLSFFMAVFFATHTFAAATLPNSSVWFTPADAPIGSAIALNALVYNNQTQNINFTVDFTVGATLIGTVTEVIPAQTAKTLSYAWVMPKVATVVTAKVIAAANTKKQSVPALVGTLGTVTVGGVTPIISTVLPGGSLTTWFAPALANLETYRVQQSVKYVALRDSTKSQLNITMTNGMPTIPSEKSLGNPSLYLTLIYSTALATLFSNVAVFYIACILLILLVLRFIVKLLF